MLARNNTDYPVKLASKLRKLHEAYKQDGKWSTILKYYQYMVRQIMTDPEYGIGADGNARGLLIYHDMGMGKTRLAVATAMSMCDVRQVVVMLPRSLQKNFNATISEVVAKLNAGGADISVDAIRSKISFVSMDAYNAADQLARTYSGNLDNKLFIVDEAHNFFRAIINSSAEQSNARRIYDIVMRSKNIRILFLTGTPCSKDPFEIVPCFNMLTGRDLLPPQYEQFYRLYIDAGGVVNADYLANRLIGLVSHVTPYSTTFADGSAEESIKKPRDLGWFPEELPVIVQKVPMSAEQYKKYLLAREQEAAEGKGSLFGGPGKAVSTPLLSLPGSEKKAMRSYFVKSRMLSTYCPGDGNAPKLDFIAQRAVDCPGPILVYSQFVESSLKPLGKHLDSLGFDRFGGVRGGSSHIEVDSFYKNAKQDDVCLLTHIENRLNDQICWEFEACKLSNLIKKIADSTKNPETIKCVERWFLSSTPGRTLKPWNFHSNIDFDDAFKKFKSELHDIKVDTSLADVMSDFIKNTVQTEIRHRSFEITEVPNDEHMILHIKDDKEEENIKISKSQYNILFDNSLHDQIILIKSCESDSEIEHHRSAMPRHSRFMIAVSALRYAAMLVGSQQLGIPRSDTDELFALGIKNEAFASPFNSRFIKYIRSGAHYCSLNYDTDSMLGSLGPFQEIDMLDYEGGWWINPPYVETTISYVANKIDETMQKDDTKQIEVLIPAWDDFPGVQSIITSKYHKTVDVLAKSKHKLETPEGYVFSAPFKLYRVHFGKKEKQGGEDTDVYEHADAPVTEETTAETPIHMPAAVVAKRSYAIISGEIPNEERERIVKTFNSLENAHGELIKCIMVSKTGAEGLDLKFIRETHQVEPYWDKARDHQVIARAVRLGSHDGLPEEERVVQPYLYIGTPNAHMYGLMLERDREPETIDEIFFNRANQKFKLIQSMRTLLSEVCLECEIFGYKNCRTCVPTNSALFHDDPATDTRLPNPCEIRQEKDISATPIEYKGITYYYYKDDSSLYGYRVYQFNEEMNYYTELDQPSDVLDIIDEIGRA